LRFGVGFGFWKGQTKIDYAWGGWNEEEKDALVKRLERIGWSLSVVCIGLGFN